MNCQKPTIPGTAQYQDCECATGTGVDCGDWYSSCRNPLWALDHPDECGLLTVTSLDLVPRYQSVAFGRSGAVRVIATFGDGSHADVTGESTIGSSDASISHHLGGGIVTGDKIGTAFLTATWHGTLATGSVSVFDNACAESAPWDVVVIADDASVATMTQRATIAGVTVSALRRFRTNVDYARSIYAFVLSLDLLDNGLFIPGVGWDAYAANPIGIGGSTRTGRDRIWTGYEWSDHTCPFPNVSLAFGSMGNRIMKAFEIFQSGRPEAKKLLVLFSTGGDTGCNPSYRGAAAAVALNGIDIAVITPLSPSDTVVSPCEAPYSAYSALQDCASRPCLFFGAGNGGLDAGSGITGKLLRLACEDCIGSSGPGVGTWLV